VEPVPETSQALALLHGYGDELDVELRELGAAVLRIVPECVGMSLALLREGLTFTLVAGHSEVGRLDPLQHIAGTPDVDPATVEEVPEASPGPLDERRWLAFARGQAVAGVRSSLTLPILEGQDVVATLNLYAATEDAFEGRTGALAQAAGALESEAVANADLSFSTRLSAAATPMRLEDQGIVDGAVGLLAGELRTDLDSAARRLRDAAARAGVNVVQLARVLWRLPAQGGQRHRD
jgi:hypothetical protein